MLISPRVHQALSEWEKLAALPYPKGPDGQDGEDAFGARADAMNTHLLAVALARCSAPLDLPVKLTVLCRMLRENLDVEDEISRLTYLLAEGARDAALLDAVKATAGARQP